MELSPGKSSATLYTFWTKDVNRDVDIYYIDNHKNPLILGVTLDTNIVDVVLRTRPPDINSDEKDLTRNTRLTPLPLGQESHQYRFTADKWFISFIIKW